jgi:hypothetical protein
VPTKVGRNDLCPCGSGKKFKKCHLGRDQETATTGDTDAAYTQRRNEAARIQRERQQGLGRPIIAAEFKGKRFVAVRSRLFSSENFNTFHDFLMRYIMATFGPTWHAAEVRNPEEDRHPVALWYQTIHRQQRRFLTGNGAVQSMPYTGAAAAFLRLAYDLYSLDHNVELQERLLSRLRNRRTFSGARYETYVAAIFIRAGFDLVFEDEQDGSTTHCEFTATYRETGKQFSVEAKRREGRRLRLGGLFNDALSKRANYMRIVFMDINTRDDGRGDDRPPFLNTLRRHLRRWEGTPLNGQPRPSAYVVMTNSPWEYELHGLAPRSSFLAEGFQIPAFKEDARFPTLRHAIIAREAHSEMHKLLQSLQDHSHIPSTFDGSLDVYSFGAERPVRIAVGSRYLFPHKNGEDRIGLVTSATVSEREAKAFCAVTFDGDAGGAIYTFPLSEDGLKAYRRHPDTFFGVPSQRTTTAETLLDLYDFFHDTYRHSSRETLLGFIQNWPDVANLASLSQADLASVYAERMAMAAWRRRGTGSPTAQR